MSRFPRVVSLLVLPLLAQPALAQTQVQVQPPVTTTNAQTATTGMAPASQLPPVQSTNDPAPPVSSPVIGRPMTVVRQAGRGGQVAYAREGVLELGGGLNFTSTTDYLQLSVQPFFGYFLTNNFELSFLGDISFSRVGRKGAGALNPTAVALLVQPSFHLPITPVFFAYAGVGVGAAYLKANKSIGGDHGWGFAFEPELGMNILIGRSGILSPSANILLATSKVLQNQDDNKVVVSLSNSIGANLRYSIMF